MQLTRHTDYALRLLIYLAGLDGARAQIAQVAQAQAISRTHLMKIANELARAGFIEAVRGRGGGIRLCRDPADINLAELVRAMEPACPLVECGSCRLVGSCTLPRALGEAASAFYAALAGYSLADIMAGPSTPAADRREAA
jgi:Rrf2 family nitric oxide-sensitive transcriptional repressor